MTNYKVFIDEFFSNKEQIQFHVFSPWVENQIVGKWDNTEVVTV